MSMQCDVQNIGSTKSILGDCSPEMRSRLPVVGGRLQRAFRDSND
jgi:hypothetical protein